MSRKKKGSKLHPHRNWEVGKAVVERCCIEGDYYGGVVALHNLAGEDVIYVAWTYEFVCEEGSEEFDGQVCYFAENSPYSDLVDHFIEDISEAVGCGIVDFYNGEGRV